MKKNTKYRSFMERKKNFFFQWPRSEDKIQNSKVNNVLNIIKSQGAVTKFSAQQHIFLTNVKVGSDT
jgi:hypothetical protein